MALDDHAEARVLDFLAIKVGYEYTLQSVATPHLKGEKTLLHLHLICVCPKTEIVLQKVLHLGCVLYSTLVRLCWRSTAHPWVLCGFNVLTSLVKATLKKCFALFYSFLNAIFIWETTPHESLHTGQLLEIHWSFVWKKICWNILWGDQLVRQLPDGFTCKPGGKWSNFHVFNLAFLNRFFPWLVFFSWKKQLWLFLKAKKITILMWK